MKFTLTVGVDANVDFINYKHFLYVYKYRLQFFFMLKFDSLKKHTAKADFISMNLFSTRRVYSFLFITAIIFTFNFSNYSQDEKDPIQIFNHGQDAHEKGDFKLAIKFYEEALKIAPEFPEAEFQRGNAFNALGFEKEAEKSFRRSIELRENWILPMVSLAEILTRNAKYEDAQLLLDKVIELDDKNTSSYSTLTEIYLKTNAPDQKLKSFLLKIISLSNFDAPLWAARGAIESKLGDKKSAKNSLINSLNFDSKNSFALSELTNILLGEKKPDEALSYARQLVKYYPNSVSGNLLLARVFAETGNLDEAFKTIETLDEKNTEVANFKNSLIANGSKNVAELEKQLEKDNKNITILGRLCILTRTTPSKALEFCRRASEADPSNISHAIGFGAALVQAKQFDQAIILFRKLLTIDSENFLIHANLATALFELNRFAEAKAEYQWLIKNKPDLSVAYYFLAIAHDNLQEYSEAQINYQKFLQLADSKLNQLEIDKVNLRLPTLEKQIKQGGGKKKGT